MRINTSVGQLLEDNRNYKEGCRIKTSFNKIELIEDGDRVNGDYIIQVSPKQDLIFTNLTYYDEKSGEERHISYKNEDIKSIVTKEQYQNCEYHFEEE